jgi:hypothetical protein
VSFLVIERFWRTRRHLYEDLVDYDEGLLALNTFWLMIVLFLPFPTARLFTETRLRADSTVLYLGTMLVISLLALAQLWWVGRHPKLCGEPDGRLARSHSATGRSPVHDVRRRIRGRGFLARRRSAAGDRPAGGSVPRTALGDPRGLTPAGDPTASASATAPETDQNTIGRAGTGGWCRARRKAAGVGRPRRRRRA